MRRCWGAGRSNPLRVWVARRTAAPSHARAHLLSRMTQLRRRRRRHRKRNIRRLAGQSRNFRMSWVTSCGRLHGRWRRLSHGRDGYPWEDGVVRADPGFDDCCFLVLLLVLSRPDNGGRCVHDTAGPNHDASLEWSLGNESTCGLSAFCTQASH